MATFAIIDITTLSVFLFHKNETPNSKSCCIFKFIYCDTIGIQSNSIMRFKWYTDHISCLHTAVPSTYLHMSIAGVSKPNTFLSIFVSEKLVIFRNILWPSFKTFAVSGIPSCLSKEILCPEDSTKNILTLYLSGGWSHSLRQPAAGEDYSSEMLPVSARQQVADSSFYKNLMECMALAA